MPRVLPLPTLSSLCLEKICKADKNFDFDYDLLLPKFAIEVLMYKFRNKNRVCKKHVRHLIKHGLTKLHVNIDSNELGEDILNKIGDIQHSLKDLKITFKPTMVNFVDELQAFRDLIPKLRNVRKLELDLISICYETVYLLKHCKHLEHLKISDLDTADVIFALKTFKHLKTLLCEDTVKALHRLTLEKENFTCGLTNMAVDCWNPAQVPLAHMIVKQVAAMTGPVRRIDFKHFHDDVSLTCLEKMKFDELKTLNVHAHSGKTLMNTTMPIDEFLLRPHGVSLAEISISYVKHIHIDQILDNCPNLKNLKIVKFDDFVGIEAAPAKKLEELTLEPYPSSNWASTEITRPQWTLFLKEAVALKAISLKHMQCAPLKESLTQDVYPEHDFPNLESLELINCCRIDLADLLVMIERSNNPLKRVSVSLKHGSAQEWNEYKRRVKPAGVKVSYKIKMDNHGHGHDEI